MMTLLISQFCFIVPRFHLIGESLAFSGKFFGMLITAVMLGFVIGGGFGLMVMSVLHSFQSENLPTKKAMMIGGIIGAIVGGMLFSYLAL